jgi:hypothetical protein
VGRQLLGGKPGMSASFDVLGQFAHGFLGDDASFAMGKRNFRLIDSRQDFRARALSLLPQAEGFLHCVFLSLKPPAVDRAPDKCFLIGG